MRADCNNCAERDKNVLLVRKKELSFICATIVISGMLLFCAGYFWGKRFAVTQYTAAIKKIVDEQEKWKSIVGSSTQESMQNALFSLRTDPVIHEKESENIVWFARLVGFPKEHSAIAYKKLVESRSGIELDIVKKLSVYGKKSKYWYQILTKHYQSKQALESVIKIIEKIKPLGKSVKIEHIQRDSQN